MNKTRKISYNERRTFRAANYAFNQNPHNVSSERYPNRAQGFVLNKQTDRPQTHFIEIGNLILLQI